MPVSGHSIPCVFPPCRAAPRLGAGRALLASPTATPRSRNPPPPRPKPPPPCRPSRSPASAPAPSPRRVSRSSAARWSGRRPPCASSMAATSPTATPSTSATCWPTRRASSCRTATGRSCGFPSAAPASRRGFHLRGVEVLQDGIPVNLADGSGDFYQIDPLAIRSRRRLPGRQRAAPSALPPSAAPSTSSRPPRYTAEAPNILRAEGGSYGTWRLSGQVSRVFGDWDALLNATALHSDGYRRHSRSQYEQFNANVGYRIAPNVETRFYAGAYIVRQLAPRHPQPAPTRWSNPRNAAPGRACCGNQARNVWAERFANRTTAELGYGRFDLDSWITHKRLYHPIFQVLDQDGLTWGVAPRFTTAFDVGGPAERAGGRRALLRRHERGAAVRQHPRLPRPADPERAAGRAELRGLRREPAVGAAAMGAGRRREDVPQRARLRGPGGASSEPRRRLLEPHL